MYYSFRDCCEQCCDCDNIDPKKDRVIISAPLSPDEKHAISIAVDEQALKKMPVEVMAKAMTATCPDAMLQQLEEVARLADARRIVEEAEQIQRAAAEAEELRKAKELAEALEVQEAIEAQDLWEAQQESLREHEMIQSQEEEEDRLRYEEAQRIREISIREAQEDELRVNTFLKANGFADIDAKRTKMFKSFYPLHVAVSQNNPDMVQLMLATGARPLPKNSGGLTPLELAQKLDKKGSHAQVIKLLTFGACT
mmetsp:Transcript_361/g.509  ORF Transcript_361/g.509 Transcript_361/m.509 type:complete len:254 (-) Transcript_361:57-818(-)